jgi:hypothetical protein
MATEDLIKVEVKDEVEVKDKGSRQQVERSETVVKVVIPSTLLRTRVVVDAGQPCEMNKKTCRGLF